MVASGRVLLVTKSVHRQNTAHIAQAMAEEVGAECVAPADCPYERLAGYDVLGLGSGIYYGRVHEELWQWALGLPANRSDRLRVLLFTTSGLPCLATFWHRPLKSVLSRKGYRVIGEFACRGFDTWGPLWLTGGLNRSHPDDRDLQHARDFIAAAVRRRHGP